MRARVRHCSLSTIYSVQAAMTTDNGNPWKESATTRVPYEEQQDGRINVRTLSHYEWEVLSSVEREVTHMARGKRKIKRKKRIRTY
jgi:hypothetical protein